MTDRRVGLFWPLGARVFLAVGGLVFAVTLLRTSESLSWSYQEWAHTNNLFGRMALDFTGPIAAAFGAFLSGRLTPPSRMYALPRFSRDPAQILAHSLGPAALVVTSGYVLALVPVVTLTYRTATAGSLAPINAVAAVVTLNALLVVGWLIGLFAQSALAAPIAFGAAFAATVVGYTKAFNAVTPVIGVGGWVGQRETPELMMFRLSFYVVVLVVALLTASAVLTTRGFERRLPPVRHTLWWILPAAFLIVGIVKPPTVIVRDADPPQTCRNVTGIEYCVHQAHVKDLDALVDEVAPVIALVGRENLPFDRVYDYSLSEGPSTPRDPRLYYADVAAEFGATGNRGLLIGQLTGGDVCATRPERQQSEQEFNAFMLSIRLRGDREDRPDNRFSRLSDQQLRQWLTEHRSQVNSCDITNDLLP